MRKLFSILAVALFALSAHATVVTQDLEFSRFSKYGEGEEATVSDGTITATVAWKGAQIWFGNDESAFDASEYEALVLELASASAVDVNYVIYYADATANNDITIPAGQTSAQLVLKSNKIQKIVIQLTEIGSATLAGLYFKGYAGKVKEEAVGFDQCPNNGNLGIGNDAWTYSVQAYSGRFSSLGLQVDDKLVIKYELSGSDDQFRILACADAENVFDFASENGSCINPEAGTTSIAFPLNSTDLALLTNKGIKIDGKNMTITGISVLKHAVLWTGSQAIGKWSNDFDIPASKLSDLQVGNILCLRVSEIGTTDAPRVTLAYGDSWTIFNPTVEYYFQSGDEAPMVVEFPVTYKMKQQLDGNKLVIRGVNYTVTDIYIKEGTPTNTVAGYLNVTDAGMATLVLPFDVPTLPTGVQAYNLTNNGDATIWAEEVTSLQADKPVLIIANENAEGYEFVSEEGASDDISGKAGTFTNGALVGTYTTIDHLDQQTGSAYNYILSNGDDGVAFYQVLDASCSVDPYRAYLSCGYNASTAGPTPAPMRIVFHKDGTTGVENTESAKMDGSTKFIRDGQLIILRNGVEYNANGALVK